MTTRSDPKICVRTAHGTMVDLINPSPESITLKDIAYGLSGINRYTGHSRLTVAEHSVIVSALVPPRLEKAGLLHDAAEAYLGDVGSPLKAAMRHVEGGRSSYDELYARMEHAIARRFGLVAAEFSDEDVKAADNLAAVGEGYWLFFRHTEESPPPWGARPWCLPSAAAEELFLKRARELGVEGP